MCLGTDCSIFSWNARLQCSFSIQSVYEICLMDNDSSVGPICVPRGPIVQGLHGMLDFNVPFLSKFELIVLG